MNSSTTKTTLAAVLICATLSATAVSGVITVPAGLNRGDQYRLAFVTSYGGTATSQAIGDYNSFVSNVANSSPELSALATTWKVIGSTFGVSAMANTLTDPNVSVGVPIYRLDGTRVADDNANLWLDVLHAPLDITQLGTVFDGPVWTGTNSSGLPDPNYYLGATTPALGLSSVYTTGAWLSNSLDYSFFQHPFYAMSDVLTAVPEPSTIALAALGLIGLAVFAMRRRRITSACSCR